MIITSMVQRTKRAIDGVWEFDPTHPEEGRREPRDTLDPPIELRPERVSRFLEEQEGCAWQGQIVTETDWSPAKTSRILSEMERDGVLTRYQVGRRKLVCVPGHEPDAMELIPQ